MGARKDTTRARVTVTLQHPHPETAELAELGLVEWARQVPPDDGGALVDLEGDTPIRWTPDRGWTEDGALSHRAEDEVAAIIAEGLHAARAQGRP